MSGAFVQPAHLIRPDSNQFESAQVSHVPCTHATNQIHLRWDPIIMLPTLQQPKALPESMLSHILLFKTPHFGQYGQVGQHPSRLSLSLQISRMSSFSFSFSNSSRLLTQLAISKSPRFPNFQISGKWPEIYLLLLKQRPTNPIPISRRSIRRVDTVGSVVFSGNSNHFPPSLFLFSFNYIRLML